MILDEPELHFGKDVLVPDIAGWRRERMPRLPDVAHLALAPDWLCEVLSPSTETIDRGKKLAIYAREGVRTCGSSTRCSRRSRCLRLESQRWSLGRRARRQRAACAPSRSTPSSSSSARSGRKRVSPSRSA